MTSTTATPTNSDFVFEQIASAESAPPVADADTRNANAFAITSFVLGIASIVAGWTFAAPIVGLVFGILARRRITTERALATWGIWLNGIMLALSVLMLVALLAFGAIMLIGGLIAV